MTSKLKSAAYHEAGHALVAHVLGRELVEVSILLEGECEGHTDHKPAGETSIEMKAVMKWSGICSEILAGSSPADLNIIDKTDPNIIDKEGRVWRSTSSDIIQIFRLFEDAEKIRSDSTEGWEAFIDSTYNEAIRLLEAHRPAVEALAKALLEEKKISGDRARTIIEEAINEAKPVFQPGSVLHPIDL